MEENTQIAREAYRLFGQGDIDGILDLYTEDVEFVFPGPGEFVPLSGTYRGKEQVRQFFGKVYELLEFTSFEPREFVSNGDKVIVIGHDTGKVRMTDKSFEEDWVHISTFRNGKVARWQAFVDTARLVNDFKPEKAKMV